MQVPQDVEHGFDQGFSFGGAFPRRHEQQIDIGMRRHLTAPVSADRHHRQTLGIGAGRDLVEVLVRDPKRQLDDGIGQKGIRSRGAPGGQGRGIESGGDLLSPGGERLTQAGHRRSPDRARALRLGLGAGRVQGGCEGWDVHKLSLRNQQGAGLGRAGKDWIGGPVRNQDRRCVLGRGQGSTPVARQSGQPQGRVGLSRWN